MDFYDQVISESPAEDAAIALAQECRRKDRVIAEMRRALEFISLRDKDWECRPAIARALELG